MIITMKTKDFFGLLLVLFAIICVSLIDSTPAKASSGSASLYCAGYVVIENAAQIDLKDSGTFVARIDANTRRYYTPSRNTLCEVVTRP